MTIMMKDLRDYSKSMASEEISDPLELLKSISSLLNSKGGIIGPNEAAKIAGCMRNCKKLVGRCIYLSILRVTKSEEILRKFMSEGGWKIMNKWISDGKETDNIPIVLEILKILSKLPVTIQHLRENNTPKIVKHFAKSSNTKLKSAASVLMGAWMAIITGTSGPSTGDAEPPKKKKKEKEKKKVKSDAQLKAKSENNKMTPPPVMKAPSFAKFRKTGLETEQSLPKKKAKTKPDQVIGKRNSTDADSSVPEKKMKPTVESKPKKIMVSEGFMDALNSASNPLPLLSKKIKRRPLKPTSQGSNSNSSNSNKAQTSPDVATGDANDFSATELLRKLSPKRTESPVPTEPSKPKLNKYGRPMKTVRFKTEEFLESVRYFDIDENERANVSTQSFKDAQHREMMIERQLLKGGKMSLVHEDTGEGEWRKPLQILNLETLVIPGCNSVEKDIQTEREKTVLMSIFLSKDMVPETPAEPDPEPYEIMQPKIIPFDDETTIADSIEPDPEQGTTANDVIMKNMLTGMQQQDGADLTEQLKQILQTASAITGNNGTSGQQDSASQPPMMQPQPGQEMQPGMMWTGEVPPQGNPQMGGMDMNGQMQPQMGFYGTQMMVPMPDPNYFPQNWNGPPPQHHGGPPMAPPGMNGPPPPMYNQGWGGGDPQWRGGPPPPRGGSQTQGGRNDYRGNWRGQWHGDRRR